jgi:IclR family pca regulon transcriptional regulator
MTQGSSALLRIVTDISDDPDFVTAFANGLAVLHAFYDRRRGISMADVSHMTGISRATVRRSLHTLQRLGYVVSDEGRRFSLGPKVTAFSHAYLSGTRLAVLGQPVLDRLSERTLQPSSLAVLDGDEIVFVARSVQSRIMSPRLNVGGRIPAYCTSIGRVILASRSDEEIEAYFTRTRIDAYTSHTVTSRVQLMETIRAARSDGFAFTDQQRVPGCKTIAVPVADSSGQVVAGISIIDHRGHLTCDEAASRYMEPLQDAARTLGASLSCPSHVK